MKVLTVKLIIAVLFAFMLTVLYTTSQLSGVLLLAALVFVLFAKPANSALTAFSFLFMLGGIEAFLVSITN